MVRKTLHGPFLRRYLEIVNWLTNLRSPVRSLYLKIWQLHPRERSPLASFDQCWGQCTPSSHPTPRACARIVGSITLTPAYLSRSLCFSSSTFSCMDKHCSKLVFAACNSFVSLRTIATSNRDKAVSVCS